MVGDRQRHTDPLADVEGEADADDDPRGVKDHLE